MNIRVVMIYVRDRWDDILDVDDVTKTCAVAWQRIQLVVTVNVRTRQ